MTELNTDIFTNFDNSEFFSKNDLRKLFTGSIESFEEKNFQTWKEEFLGTAQKVGNEEA